MRTFVLPENDMARNLDVVISRGRVHPGFRDDKIYHNYREQSFACPGRIFCVKPLDDF